jgi:hypothetical protein
MYRQAPISRRFQGGAVIVTVCLLMLFLLGFVGFALDFGRAFVVKTELQSAMDSCALSAAGELDGTANAITRAKSAGLTAGNANPVEFQSASWRGKGQLVDSEITFRDTSYALTTNPVVAQYVECQHTQPSFQLWLIQAMAAFSGDTTTFPSNQNIFARAVATRAHSQSACPLPLALKPAAGGTAANNYGFTVGQWVKLLMGPGEATNGEIGWANLDGSNNAAETVAEMDGFCGTEVGDTLGTPGVQATVADNWNYRFGIYKGPGNPSVYKQRPDFTGYSYTATNWPSSFNAYDGTVPAGAHPTAGNFVTKRLAFASCADTGTQLRGSPNSCEGITGLALNSFSKLAAPGMTTGGHRQYGMDRRIVVVPVVNATSNVIDWACMFMLQPLSIPLVPVWLEYRGLAGAPGSPCTTTGMPGTTGPLIPVLVR